MREQEESGRFRRDFRRVSRGPYASILKTDFLYVIRLLSRDEKLPPKHQDHALKGKWKGYCECHIRPDLLLIYRKTADNKLELLALGSHSDLFG